MPSAPLAVRIIAVLLTLAALKLGAPVLVPLAGGLFVATLLRPMHAALRARLPARLRFLALLAAFLVTVVGLGAFFSGLTVSAQAVMGEIDERRPQLEARIEELRRRLTRTGIEPAATKPPPDAAGKVAGAAAIATGTALGKLILVVAFAILALAEVENARERLRKTGPGGERALRIFDEVGPAFRRYAGVKTLTSTITGTFTGLASWGLGLPLPYVWGFLAFLFEYVPSVGSIISIVPPVLIALAVDGPAKAGITLLVIGGGQIILGNIVDPRIEGRLMPISPFTVLLSIIVWGWLWGAGGALMAVPFTVALTLAGKHLREFSPLGTLLTGDADE
jgi:AI-2 transport protein TqsA